MRTRGILPTNRPDDIPLADWQTLLHGQLEALNRAFARLWILLLLRPTRRLWPNVARLVKAWIQ